MPRKKPLIRMRNFYQLRKTKHRGVIYRVLGGSGKSGFGGRWHTEKRTLKPEVVKELEHGEVQNWGRSLFESKGHKLRKQKPKK